MTDSEKLMAVAALIRSSRPGFPLPSEEVAQAFGLTCDRWCLSRYAGFDRVLGGALAGFLEELAQRLGHVSHADMLPAEDGLALGAREGFGSINDVLAENNFVSTDVEARLADEVRRLSRLLVDGAARFQAIGNVAARGEYGQLVSVAFQLLAFQFSNALLQLGGESRLFHEHAKQLGDMSLGLQDAFREIRLDGHKFLAIAYPDKAADDGSGRAEV